MSSITSVIAGNLLSLALVCVLRLTSSIVPADYVRAFEAALFVTQTFTAGWTAVLLGRHLVDHHEIAGFLVMLRIVERQPAADVDQRILFAAHRAAVG